jgi:hypothetical protein
MDMLLWFASRDIHIAATFSRGFYWTDINLWPADLPDNACVVLSGNDALLSAQAVQRMLAATTPHVKVRLGRLLRLRLHVAAPDHGVLQSSGGGSSAHAVISIAGRLRRLHVGVALGDVCAGWSNELQRLQK